MTIKVDVEHEKGNEFKLSNYALPDAILQGIAKNTKISRLGVAPRNPTFISKMLGYPCPYGHATRTGTPRANTTFHPTYAKTVAIRVELPDNLRNEFKSVVAREGKNMRDVLVDFIEDYVKNRSIQSKKD